MVALGVPLLVGVVVVVGQARPRLVPRQAHWDSGHSQRRLNNFFYKPKTFNEQKGAFSYEQTTFSSLLIIFPQ